LSEFANIESHIQVIHDIAHNQDIAHNETYELSTANIDVDKNYTNIAYVESDELSDMHDAKE
jgi:hypothetical protein